MARIPKYLLMLGLAEKAGKIASGEMMTEKAIQNGSAHLVLVSGDASDNTKKKFTDLCAYYHVDVYFRDTMEMIGHAIGKEFRASLAVTDPEFAKMVIRNLETGTEGNIGGNS